MDLRGRPVEIDLEALPDSGSFDSLAFRPP